MLDFKDSTAYQHQDWQCTWRRLRSNGFNIVPPKQTIMRDKRLVGSAHEVIRSMVGGKALVGALSKKEKKRERERKRAKRLEGKK